MNSKTSVYLPMEGQQSPSTGTCFSSEEFGQNSKVLSGPLVNSPVLSLAEEELMEDEVVLAAGRVSQQHQFIQGEPCLQFSLRTSPLASEQIQTTTPPVSSYSELSVQGSSSPASHHSPLQGGSPMGSYSPVHRGSPMGHYSPVPQPAPQPAPCSVSLSSHLMSDSSSGGGGIHKCSDLDVRTSSSSGPLKQLLPPSQTYKPLYNPADNNGISVTLEGQELWDEFYKRGTEMIVNRAGRRMFPGFAVNVSGLKPKYKYTMKMEMVLADKHRFKFLNCRWIPIGSSDPQPPSIVYTHPDSPNSGGYWMRQGVSFRKVKITNNKENPKGNVLLHSMHKYFVRLVIEEHKKGANSTNPPKTVLVREFPETTFITVTAYQNEEVTQLKISNNPFAKAFREGSGQYDWDTLQMIYGPHSQFRGAEHSPVHMGNCQTMTPPLVPPLPLPHGMPHLPSPAWCSAQCSGSGYMQDSPSYSPYPQPAFDWPSNQGQTSSPLANQPPIHPASASFVDHRGKMATTMFPAFQNQYPNDSVTHPHAHSDVHSRHTL